MWILVKSYRFRFLIPQLMWSGISIAYYSGNLVEMMSGAYGGDDNALQFKWSMLAMVGFGFGEILGGFVVGYIVDRFGTKMAILWDLLVMVIMFIITLIFIV